jgi:SAM-dependent methyltransferase
VDGESLRIQHLKFFSDRAKRIQELGPIVAMLYQDDNPSLAVQRDQHEIKFILPFLDLNKTKSVLDIGCGLGRWGLAVSDLVETYIGTDFSAELINEIEIDRFPPNYVFQVEEAFSTNHLKLRSNFDVVIFGGVVMYLSDEELIEFNRLLHAMIETWGNFRFYIRASVAITRSFRLDSVWSKELNHEYSAIYRNVDDLKKILFRNLSHQSNVLSEGILFPEDMNIRKNSTAYYWVGDLRRE